MNLNLKTAYDMFIFEKETYCLASTLSNYKNTLKYFIDFLEHKFDCNSAAIYIDDLTLNDINDYIRMLRKRDKLSTHVFKPTVKHPVTDTTVRTYCTDIRTFFNYLYDNDLMQHDLMKHFKLIKGEEKIIIPLFQDDVKTLDSLFNLKTVTGCRNYCIFHLMLDAGLRSGEVVHLKTSDIDFQNNFIIVLCAKGKKDRVVPLAPLLKKHLFNYINLYRAFCNSDILFISTNGSLTPITENSIKSLFSRLRTKSNINRLKPHLLRHTFATSFILYGGNLEALRIYLGHASYEITKRYLHIATVFQRNKVYKLDTIFFNNFRNY